MLDLLMPNSTARSPLHLQTFFIKKIFLGINLSVMQSCLSINYHANTQPQFNAYERNGGFNFFFFLHSSELYDPSRGLPCE